MTSESQPGKRGGGPIQLIDTERDDYEHPASESSPLLGAGAGRDDANTSNGNGPPEPTWDGAADFEGLPWHKRPSIYWLIGPYFLFTLAFGGSLVPRLNLIVDLVCRNYFADRQLADPAFTFTPVVLGADNPQCNVPGVQREVATFTLVMSVLTGVLSALTAPKLGSLSDRYGRKRLMVIASCGGVLNEVITILAARFPEAVDYNWLILGAFFDGATGSFTAGSLLSHSYTSDCSPPSRRGVNIGYLHACLFTGLAVGPLLAGYFVKWTGTLLSIFYVTLACHVFFIAFIYLAAPESLSKARQKLAREKHRAEKAAAAERLQAALLPRSSPSFLDRAGAGMVAGGRAGRASPAWLTALLSANPLAPLRILAPGGQGSGALRRNIVLLAAIDTVILSTAMAAGTATVLYSEYMFGWGTVEASEFVSVTSFVRVVVLLCLFPLVNYVFRVRPMRRRHRKQWEADADARARARAGGDAGAGTGAGVGAIVETNAGADNLDVWLIRVALASDLVGLVGYVLVRTPVLFVACGVVTACGGIGSAVIQSAITKHVPAERVGSLLGALGLLHALGRVFAPILFNGLYAATVESFPQAFFVLLASLFGLALVASLFVRPHLYFKDDGNSADGYVAVPVRDAGHASDSETLADEEMPSETLPRIP